MVSLDGTILRITQHRDRDGSWICLNVDLVIGIDPCAVCKVSSNRNDCIRTDGDHVHYSLIQPKLRRDPSITFY